MRYSTIVEHDDKALLEIIDALEQFEKDRFIAGIQARNYTTFDLEQVLEMIHVYQSKMNIEARALAKFSETFIGEFATDNNKCFESAGRLFNRIRSTLSALKKVFHKTCPRSMSQLPQGVQNPSVFERSALSRGACVIDMFGLESYSEVVQKLYGDLETLLTTATNILSLCHQMIESEDNIRHDTEQLKTIYRQSCNQLLSSVHEFAAFMGTPQQIPESELTKRKANARSMDEFLEREYHNVAKHEFKKYVWIEALRKGKNKGLSEEELFIWGEHTDKVEDVRWAIEHFDEMVVEGQQGKLDSTIMVYFLKWCGVHKYKEKRLYKYFCDNYHGRYQPLVWSAISKERKDQQDSGVTDMMAADSFQKMVAELKNNTFAVGK